MNAALARIVVPLFAVLCIVLLLASPAAGSDAQDEARDLFVAASAAMKQGELRRAAELYEQSFSKYPAPTTAFWQARTLVRLGRLIEARERYRVAARWSLDEHASEEFRASVADAASELGKLEKRIPVVVLDVEPGVAAVIMIDGRRVPGAGRQPIDPGDHVVSATAPGRQSFETSARAAEGEETLVRIRFSSPAATNTPPSGAPAAVPSHGSAQRAAGFVIGGVGIAGLVTWGVTGVLFLNNKSAAQDAGCDFQRNTCPTDAGLSAVQRGKTLGVVNTVALFSGVALTGLGLVLIATSKGSPASGKSQGTSAVR